MKNPSVRSAAFRYEVLIVYKKSPESHRGGRAAAFPVRSRCFPGAFPVVFAVTVTLLRLWTIRICDSYTLLRPWPIRIVTVTHFYHLGPSELQQLHTFTISDFQNCDSYTLLPFRIFRIATVTRFYHFGFSELRQLHTFTTLDLQICDSYTFLPFYSFVFFSILQYSLIFCSSK